MTQYQKARALAKAFTRLDQARLAVIAAETEVNTLFGPVAASFSTNRDEVRKALLLSGLLPHA